MMFTAEEMYLLDGCDMASRRMAIRSLLRNIHITQDDELKEEQTRLCRKLLDMSDEAFDKMDWTLDDF